MVTAFVGSRNLLTLQIGVAVRLAVLANDEAGMQNRILIDGNDQRLSGIFLRKRLMMTIKAMFPRMDPIETTNIDLIAFRSSTR